MYQQYLEQPYISTAYQCTKDTDTNQRILMAATFLANKEYSFDNLASLNTFEAVENILKTKVLMYAIAFASGATNGGILYQSARAELLTWRSIFEGATFVNGWLV